ncbi:hypothetical protein SS50377_21986 [Spironucleus salmonicida]|uniref:Uncharacterized protein n=1 Tax=Spironucleus salmonicida TaxID=348837 RepID=V6M1G2_9EUKA|nr:hypothetical protein SS50377_21986 [Spironucleus salmonicida]|eukprot:EST47024.1 Hypothetical protein SS50377_12980 [Spironucleus salmonicida]
MTQIITGDQAGFIRILHPFSLQKFASRLHSVTKNANTVTCVKNIDNYHIFGYENGNVGIYTLNNLDFSQQILFETKQYQLPNEIPIHHSYFDKLNSKTQFSIINVNIINNLLYVATILSEVLIFDYKTNIFIKKFQISSEYRKFITINFMHNFIIHAGYNTIPSIHNLDGTKICELQKPEIEYLTGLEKKFELTQIQTYEQFIICADARGYLYRYNIQDLLTNNFVNQKSHTIPSIEKSIQLLSFYRFEDFKITSLSIGTNLKQLNQQQKQQRQALISRKTCAQNDNFGPKRGTNPVKKVFKQTIFDDCILDVQLVIGTGNGAIAILDAITGLIISRNGRLSQSAITFVQVIQDGIIVCGRDKFIRILSNDLEVKSATYVVNDVVGAYQFGEGEQASDNEIEEEEFGVEEETNTEIQLETIKEVQRVQQDEGELNVDLGFFDDL